MIALEAQNTQTRTVIREVEAQWLHFCPSVLEVVSSKPTV